MTLITHSFLTLSFSHLLSKSKHAISKTSSAKQKLTMLSQEVKKLVLKIYKSLQNEKKKGSLLYSINDPIKRLIGLTGLPRTNIVRWITADEKTGKSETHASKSNKLDGFDVEVIRRKVLTMFEKK